MLRLQNSQKKYTFVVHNKIWQHFSRCFSSLLLGESSCELEENSRCSGMGCDELLSLGWKRVMNLCGMPLQLSLSNLL